MSRLTRNEQAAQMALDASQAEIARLRKELQAAQDMLGFFESAGFPTPQHILEKLDGYEATVKELARAAVGVMPPKSKDAALWPHLAAFEALAEVLARPDVAALLREET